MPARLEPTGGISGFSATQHQHYLFVSGVFPGLVLGLEVSYKRCEPCHPSSVLKVLRRKCAGSNK